MTDTQIPYDVFVTFSHLDESLGLAVASQLEYHELSVATPVKLRQLRPRILSDLIRQTIAESSAVVAVVGPQSIQNPNVMFEFGAAFAWNKLCFLVTNGLSGMMLPYALASVRQYSLSDVEVIAKEIKDSRQDLSPEDIDRISAIYKEIGVSVDSLYSKPVALSKIANTFNGERGRSLSPEQVLQHLIRLRKQSKLSKISN